MRQDTYIYVYTIAFFGLLFLPMWGCLQTQSTPKTTTGVTLQQHRITERPKKLTQCQRGTICIKLATKDVRACDIVLASSAPMPLVQATFDAEFNGQLQYKGNQIGISLVTERDADPTASRFVSALRLASSKDALKIVKSSCYDRNGEEIEGTTFSLVTPTR